MIIACRYCGKESEFSGRALLANQFHADCYEERLEAAGAIDLRDNHRIIHLDNGYARIEPIDNTKLFKAGVRA